MKNIKNTMRAAGLGVIIGSAVLGSAGVAAGQYSIDWQTIDGGGTSGATALSGGGYTLSGTVGQHDANPAGVSTGGAYALAGGFWSDVLDRRVCGPDFNHDGELNPDDLGDFITCYFSEPPCAGADYNADFDVNPDDLGDFITAYFMGC